jgi:hypothetical protein
MSKYEFTAEQSRRIKKVRVTLLHISLLMFGVAFFLMLMGPRLPSMPGGVSMLVAGLLLILGVVYFYPLVNLKRVLAVPDNDVNQILAVMDSLRTAFSVGTFIVLTFNVLTLIAIFALFF